MYKNSTNIPIRGCLHETQYELISARVKHISYLSMVKPMINMHKCNTGERQYETHTDMNPALRDRNEISNRCEIFMLTVLSDMKIIFLLL